MTANTTLPGVLLKGTAASRPAANAVASGTLYSATDTGAITQSDGVSTWSAYATITAGFSDPMTSRGDVIVRNASNVTARLGKGSAGTYLGSDGTDVAYAAVTDAQLSTSNITTNNVSTSKHGFAPILPNDATKYLDGTGAYTVPAGGGGGSDLVQTYSGGGSIYIPGMLGNPDAQPASPNANDLEFNSLTGTVLGSLSTDNVTDFPSHWHCAMAAAAPELNGRYWTIPSLPLTVTAHFTAMNLAQTLYPTIGIMLLDSGPTAIREFYYAFASSAYSVGLRRWTSRTAFSSSVDEAPRGNIYHPQVWLRVLVTSSSSVTMSYSFDGYLFIPVAGVQAISPTITPAFFGLDVSVPTSTGTTSEFVCDWVRWT